jgi:hypothetical protein
MSDAIKKVSCSRCSRPTYNRNAVCGNCLSPEERADLQGFIPVGIGTRPDNAHPGTQIAGFAPPLSPGRVRDGAYLATMEARDRLLKAAQLAVRCDVLDRWLTQQIEEARAALNTGRRSRTPAQWVRQIRAAQKFSTAFQARAMLRGPSPDNPNVTAIQAKEAA